MAWSPRKFKCEEAQTTPDVWKLRYDNEILSFYYEIKDITGTTWKTERDLRVKVW